MSEASDKARFAARKFVARWERDTGESLSPLVTDRMLFAYEMGYLRGHGDSMKTTSQMLDEITQPRSVCKKGEDDAESE